MASRFRLRSRSARRSLLGLATGPLVAAGLLLPPAAAHADHDHRRHGDRHHHRYDDHHHRHGHPGKHRGHGAYGKHHGGHPKHHGAYHRGYRPYGGHPAYRYRHAARGLYHCRPCGHSFHRRSHFHRHLSRHHHVSPGAFASVIVSFGLGWAYLG